MPKLHAYINVLKSTPKAQKISNQDLDTGRCRESFVCKWVRANAGRANPAQIYMQTQLSIAGA
jgi:hypothetical protein